MRTALVAWLFARARSARFLVRVEDLDPLRSRREFERAQLDDLRSLGIDWDEAPVRQSERTAIYDDALERLSRADRLYPCFCTRAEIREAASAPHGDLPEGAYTGTCRGLSPHERRARVQAGSPFALRLKADGELIGFRDHLFGDRAGRVDDFVVRRADGVHAYQLAVVADDGEQRIGEVVRGADLLASVPRQILLARLLGLPAPAYAHVPLVIGPDGSRLSKRDHAATVADRDEPPEATLAVLAHSLGLARGRESVNAAADLLQEFDPDGIPREPVVLGRS